MFSLVITKTFIEIKSYILWHWVNGLWILDLTLQLQSYSDMGWLGGSLNLLVVVPLNILGSDGQLESIENDYCRTFKFLHIYNQSLISPVATGGNVFVAGIFRYL